MSGLGLFFTLLAVFCLIFFPLLCWYGNSPRFWGPKAKGLCDRKDKRP